MTSTLTDRDQPQATPTTATPHAAATSQAVWLVTEREITARLRSKAFVVSTAILLAAVLAGVILTGVLSNHTVSHTKVAAVGTAATKLHGTHGVTVRSAADRTAAVKLVNAGDVDAAVLPDSSSPTKMTIIADDERPDSLVSKLSVPPKVEVLHPKQTSEAVRYLGAIGFGVVFLMSATTFGGTIAQSVVEEKQTRIVEILVSAIKTRVLLVGKIAGNSLLAFGQVALIAACAVVGYSIMGKTKLLGSLGAPIAWFVLFFIIGFVLLAAMFAAAASLVSRQEEVQSVVMPVTMLVMIPYFLVIFFNDNDTVLTVMSYVPFSAAIGMPMRILLGTAAWWEPLLALLILVASAALVIGLATRIYANALLRTGAKVSFRDALKRE
jgi:ABC-2 type transport system permease protein